MDAPHQPETLPSAPASPDDASWHDVHQHAQTLAASLRTLAPGQSSRLLSVCLAYADLVDEIARLAAAPDAAASFSARMSLLTTPKQLQDFGRLLRDKRNQVGLSRVQLARRAKLSDATVKFLETARHPPSRATLLRLIGVPELGLCWSETPAACFQTAPDEGEDAEHSRAAAELHRFDARLSVPMVLELMLVLDELHTSQSRVEITAHGARRACGVCGMRSEGWAVDAGEAAKLPLRHAVPCAGRLADSLRQRHPVIAELAQKERRSRRSPTAVDLDAARQAAPLQRFHGCRSSREVAALLARVAALPSTPYRKGVREVLLWALGLGPCPAEPTAVAFSERRAEQLAAQLSTRSAATPEAARLRGAAEGACWLVSPAVPPPGDPRPEFPDPRSVFEDSHVHT